MELKPVVKAQIELMKQNELDISTVVRQMSFGEFFVEVTVEITRLESEEVAKSLVIPTKKEEEKK